jgi:hypothetical protein
MTELTLNLNTIFEQQPLSKLVTAAVRHLIGSLTKPGDMVPVLYSPAIPRDMLVLTDGITFEFVKIEG